MFVSRLAPAARGARKGRGAETTAQFGNHEPTQQQEGAGSAQPRWVEVCGPMATGGWDEAILQLEQASASTAARVDALDQITLICQQREWELGGQDAHELIGALRDRLSDSNWCALGLGACALAPLPGRPQRPPPSPAGARARAPAPALRPPSPAR